MKIHIYDADGRPIIGENIVVNCGKRMAFNPPQYPVFWDDGRVCSECLEAHRLSTKSYTWCSVEE